jgi:hypothetical protein
MTERYKALPTAEIFDTETGEFVDLQTLTESELWDLYWQVFGTEDDTVSFLEAFNRISAAWDILEVIYPDGIPEQYPKALRDSLEKVAAEKGQTLEEFWEGILKIRDEAEKEWRRAVEDFRKEWDELDDSDE